MKLTIRDHESTDFALVSFDSIADCLEPKARKCFWQVRYVEGMLSKSDDSYTIEDAYVDAKASLVSPMSWSELRRWASRFFQIYDCEVRAVEMGSCDVTIHCIDSSQWEISTRLEGIVERLRSRFKNTEELRA
jgi:hypothetical protein